ncbi:carbohydrate ABC transporter permease [Pseudonocardia sp. MH-G8]|uniref:carbohydrate ABC transporter permease n=1 Tax=Pseudonocardia sp. MH-G8 TaxID=1854588 RepID=UPI000BA14484|nr:carbohydrate ABC transporter permease [Pseudonocardia sp. MH-G8]OZM75776.1 ABC transporter permease [Pseudonocardia sp. MH-G8]
MAVTTAPGPGAARLRAAAGTGAFWVAMAATAVVVLVPILWVFTTAVKPTPDLFAIPPSFLPRTVTGEHFQGALSSGEVLSFLRNSLVAAGGATVLSLVLAVPAAFGFARFRYRFSTVLLGAAVLTRMFPPIALALPYFLQLRAVNLIDSPIGLAIAYVPIVLPLMIWMLEGFFRDFPEEVVEAARLDGIGTFGLLTRIVVPMSRPAVAVATLFGFLAAWNEFVIALTVTRTPAAQTMPVGIASSITQFQTSWGPMTATAAVYLLPVLALTVIAQRGIVSGLTVGATKG